jgi:probable HAF family extracellular repeat protein
LEPWGEHIVLAYRWDLATGKLVQIGSLPAGNSTLCTSLNDPGQLVGRVPEKLFGTRAFVWLPESAFGLPSGIHDLGSVRGCCPRAEDINSFGEIVGTSETDIVGSERAFIWLPAPNHGLPAGSHVLDDRLAARAVAISDSGQILINTESQAFVWEAGKLTNVGSLEGSFTRAEDINSLGQVAGYARTADKGFVIHAFLWENGVIVDLNDAIPAESRWTVQEGRAINERGQIAASGIADGSEHVLLLTRLPSVVTSSPPSCAIDARQPSNLDGSNPIGWRSVVLTFDAQPGRLDPQDFRVQLDPPGASPQIASVTTTGRTVTLQFERGIPPGHWTLLTHVASESTVRLGYLPGDVNGDGSSSPLDILALVDGLNGLDSLDLWQCDIDRSNHCEPADILRVIDVLNGAGTLEPWLQRALSACP